MDAARFEDEPMAAGDAAEEEVFLWRAETLERAGYSAKAVLMLATQKAVDLHEAVSLLEAGCPPEIAVNILL